jgi:hypothetical protein
MWPDGMSLILRFRDLVTRPGDTLARHAELCAARGDRVWWGWWHKAGERAPAEAFLHLQGLAQGKGGLDILLFDSGRSLVFKARCTDLAWKSAPSATPHPDRTPTYYRDQLYLAWFELSIVGTEPVDPAVLKKWTYHRVDPFFMDAPSRFDDFYGKRVASAEELRQQDRSIWFVRPFQRQDRTHAISLLDARTLKPHNFPADFQQIPEDTLLWMSDLHFSDGAHHGFARADQPGETVGRRSMALALERALATLDRPVGGYLLAGDVTWRAAEGEFQQALAMLEHLLGRRSPYQVAVCPGNHDVAFTVDPAEKHAPIGVATPEARRAWSDFYAALYYLPPPDSLASGRRFLVGNAVPVEIACLNSSHLQQHPEAFQGHGFVGDDQLDEVAGHMGWTRAAPRALPFRIVMLHHHVVPVTHRELPHAHQSYSVVLDAVALLRWAVRHRVGLILHGHMHQPHVTRLSMRRDDGAWHTITIAGMGSTGVEQAHLGEVGKNTFGLLRFEDDAVAITFHTLHSVNPSEELPKLAVRVPYRQEG